MKWASGLVILVGHTTHFVLANSDRNKVEQLADLVTRQTLTYQQKTVREMGIHNSPEETLDIEQLTQVFTITTAEVADWHFTDLVLRTDRGRPLMQLLADLTVGAFEPVVDLRAPEAEIEGDLEADLVAV